MKDLTPGQRAHRAGVSAFLAALALGCVWLVLHRLAPGWVFIPEFLTLFALGRMSGHFGWSAGWKARGGEVAEQMRDRVASEYLAGAPASMVAVYASIEAEHIIAGHTGDLIACESSCNEAGTEWVRRRWRERKVLTGETQEA